MRHSVVRRSLIITVFFVSGHGFYYLLLLIANALLDSTGFGRLYTGWTILNVLVTPVSIISLLLSGYFAREHSSHGSAVIPSLVMKIGSIALPWTVGAVILLEVLFYAIGATIGVDSVALMLIIPPTAASFLGVEIVRAAFQGMLRFTAFGVSWLAWCAAQCALGAGGILLFGAPWACFAGMLAANVLTFAWVAWSIGLVRRNPSALSMQALSASALSFSKTFPFCTAFVGFVLFNNADVLLAYLSLSPAALGVYTASSVLPKAIVTATQPVVQIILPVVVSIKSEGQDTLLAVQKAMSTAFALGLSGFIVLWLGSDVVCGASYGIRFCDSSLMLVLAAAAVPLGVVRAWISADLARGRFWISHLSFAAIVAFVGVTYSMGGLRSIDAAKIATAYLSCCWGLLACDAVMKVAQAQFANDRKPPFYGI
jgi:O-antigen/teichoic acid export membrane protein